jgi:hypothetical protein
MRGLAGGISETRYLVSYKFTISRIDFRGDADGEVVRLASKELETRYLVSYKVGQAMKSGWI